MIGVLTRSEDKFYIGRKILFGSVNLRGIYVGSRGMFERMNRAIEQHAIKPIVDTRQ